MLDRTLLYTAHTRPKKMVPVMAAWHTVTKAVETNHLE